ncbi:RES family NAD+ phosphorylase [Mucilaginibacter polytrichastri]|nr:RES family NAD+ phosphorylase [Mucilaginibacter polytrichastri]
MSFPYDDTIGLKHVCFKCIGDEFLSEEMSRIGKMKKCAYCKTSRKGYPISHVAHRVHEAFELFYKRTADEMDRFEEVLHNDSESTFNWERHGDPVEYVIAEALMSENDVAYDIQQYLEDEHADREAAEMQMESGYQSGSYYQRIDYNDDSWQKEWDDFVASLKTESRYFNQAGARHLADVFSGLEEMVAFDKRPIVTTIGPGTAIPTLFRARIFQSNEKLREALVRPEMQLGSPPSLLANDGRMNARGISVFYGAVDEETALAEVRPPVGSQVAVASFTLLRNLKVLDLTALLDVALKGSIFDAVYPRELSRFIFLSNLAERVTQPVMPDDELFEYLPTQAIADFLATDPRFKFDGIIFKSAQVEGNRPNVVLFNKASRVEEIKVPEGAETEVEFSEYDGENEYISFRVTEVLPEDEEPAEPEEDLYDFLNPGYDSRPFTLKIDLESVTIHIVKAVKISTEPHKVFRFSFMRGPLLDE